MRHNIYILTGPVRSGKTTRMLDWANQRNVRGIGTPIIRNKRMFFDISNQEVFSMEAERESLNTLQVGKYIFSKAAFTKAEKIISDGMNNSPDFLVIDEIGPLELNGHGFNNILKLILSNEKRNYNLVLVIRDSILYDALLHFGITEYKDFNFAQG